MHCVMLFEMSLRKLSILTDDAYTRILFSTSRSKYLAVPDGEVLFQGTAYSK